MADFRKHQPRGKDGKYKTYKLIIRILKRIIDPCKKKRNFRQKY